MLKKKSPMITPMYGVEIVERKMSVKNIIYTYEKDVQTLEKLKHFRVFIVYPTYYPKRYLPH